MSHADDEIDDMLDSLLDGRLTGEQHDEMFGGGGADKNQGQRAAMNKSAQWAKNRVRISPGETIEIEATGTTKGGKDWAFSCDALFVGWVHSPNNPPYPVVYFEFFNEDGSLQNCRTRMFVRRDQMFRVGQLWFKLLTKPEGIKDLPAGFGFCVMNTRVDRVKWKVPGSSGLEGAA